MCVVKSEDVATFLRDKFGKTTGTMYCLNPHWWIYVNDVAIGNIATPTPMKNTMMLTA